MGLEEDLEGSGEMEGMLEEVEEYRKRWRFQFNEQIKVMVVSKRKKERRRWWLGAKEVEEATLQTLNQHEPRSKAPARSKPIIEHVPGNCACTDNMRYRPYKSPINYV